MGFLGLKAGFWVARIMSWQAKQKGKMVLNADTLLKNDKLEGVKGRKKRLFTYFLTNNLARTDRKLEPHCKIKDKDLRF